MHDIQKTLRVMMSSRGYNLEMLRKKYNELTGATFVKQSWNYKIKHESIRLNEFIVMCDILGYKIELEDVNTHVRLSE